MPTVAAYGLTISLARDLPGLASACSPGARHVRLDVVDAASVARASPPAGGRRLSGASPASGARVQQHPGIGWHMQAPGYGAAFVDSTARSVLYAGEVTDSWRSTRYLLAQVLPFVAGLRGLELLHAAAVAVDGEAVLLAGPSGAGKSTLVRALLDAGAGFLADDVAALELVGNDRVFVHPGPELLVLDDAGIEVRAVSALPVGVVCFISRGSAAAAVEPVTGAVDALLSTAYDSLRRDPDRLATQLAVLGAVASGARMFSVSISADAGSTDTAAMILNAVAGRP